jgi:hypothetical protein
MTIRISQSTLASKTDTSASESPLASLVRPSAREAASRPNAPPVEPQASDGNRATPSQELADSPLIAAYEQRIRSLQDSLNDRDEVVQMLTQRLEQAADQLDRLQRTGASRGFGGAGSIPAEFFENQASMAEQVAQLLGQWEELQAADSLARIEAQLNELHALIANGAGGGTRDRASESSVLEPARRSITDANAPRHPAAGWEAIKASLLAADSDGSAEVRSQPTPSDEPVAPAESPRSELATATVVRPRSELTPLPDPPPAVDLAQASREELCDAIHARDDYIADLLRRLSKPDASIEFPDWEKLNDVPEELRNELLDLRVRLHDKLRIAEVDLSLQRAKLAREEARLSMKAEQVSRQMRQLGLSSAEFTLPASPATAPAPTPGDNANAPQGRRWLQFLQRPHGG